jgi:hypothetical protein
VRGNETAARWTIAHKKAYLFCPVRIPAGPQPENHILDKMRANDITQSCRDEKTDDPPPGTPPEIDDDE